MSDAAPASEPQATDAPTAAHLAATPAIDRDHPAVLAFVHEHAPSPESGATVRERAVALSHAVRDGLLYDPYRIDLTPQGMRASQALANGYGWCVPKATLLAAACRAAGIPARLGFADVRNHLSTERMRQTMKTDLFVWHGYTEIFIDGAWRKATPAFNLSLCQKFGLHPLDFDGVHDSIYHPFDQAGNRHMEYVHQRGRFDDLPLDAIVDSFRTVYQGMWLPGQQDALRSANFATDVDRETR